MTPEEIFNKQVWEIIQRIKEESLFTPKGKPVRYRIPNIVGEGIIWPERRINILHKLQDWGALKLEPEYANVYNLYISPQKFEEVYQKYKQMNNSQDELVAVPSHEYFLTNSDLVESLQRKYNNSINLSEKGFFLGIADYVKFIDENSGFKQIISVIDGFRKRDRSKLIELEGKLFRDVNKVEKIVMNKVNSAKIDSEVIKRRINDYEMTKDGRIQSGAPKVEDLHNSLSLVIMSLHENGYEGFASDFVELVPNSKSIADYKISKYYSPYEGELLDYRSKAQKTIWGSWNELVVAYLVIHKYKEHMQELISKNDIVDQMNFQGLHQEMENVLGNAHDEHRRFHFIRDDYIVHINRVHNFIIDKLNSNPDKNAEQEERGQTLLERYEKLIAELRTSNLGERYKKVLADMKNQPTADPIVEITQVSKLGTYKLQYSSNNGFAHFNGADHIFTGKKSRALLSTMSENKGTPYSIEELKQKCNPLISNSRLHIRKEKDLYDTVMSIRKALNVNKGEFFPIQKLDENWIWIEK